MLRIELQFAIPYHLLSPVLSYPVSFLCPPKYGPYSDIQRNRDEKCILDLEMQLLPITFRVPKASLVCLPSLAGLAPTHCLASSLPSGLTSLLALIHHPPLVHSPQKFSLLSFFSWFIASDPSNHSVNNPPLGKPFLD